GLSARAWRAAHDVRLRFLGAQSQRRQQVGAQVDRQDLGDGEGQRDVQQGGGDDRQDLRDIAGKDVGGEFAQIVIDRAAFLNGRHDGRKVVVGQNDVR